MAENVHVDNVRTNTGLNKNEAIRNYNELPEVSAKTFSNLKLYVHIYQNKMSDTDRF